MKKHIINMDFIGYEEDENSFMFIRIDWKTGRKRRVGEYINYEACYDVCSPIFKGLDFVRYKYSSIYVETVNR